MKFIGCVAVFALLFNLSTQLTKFESCPTGVMDNYQDSCSRVVCDGTGDFSVLNCPELQCQPDKGTEYSEADDSKMYPDCCSRPICAN